MKTYFLLIVAFLALLSALVLRFQEKYFIVVFVVFAGITAGFIPTSTRWWEFIRKIVITSFLFTAVFTAAFIAENLNSIGWDVEIVSIIALVSGTVASIVILTGSLIKNIIVLAKIKFS